MDDIISVKCTFDIKDIPGCIVLICIKDYPDLFMRQNREYVPVIKQGNINASFVRAVVMNEIIRSLKGGLINQIRKYGLVFDLSYTYDCRYTVLINGGN